MLGLDVGQKRLHGVVWDGREVHLLAAAGSTPGSSDMWVDDALERWIDQYHPDLVAVDAPCAGGQDPRGKRGRLCETAIVDYVDRHWRAAQPEGARGRPVRFGIAATPHASGDHGEYPGWMAVGFRVYAALAAVGYPVADGAEAVAPGRCAAIEVYPDAAFWLFGMARGGPFPFDDEAPVPRKRHALAGAVATARMELLPEGLSRALEAHPEFPAGVTPRIDFIDAACAAVTGEMALAGRARCIPGRAGEGALWVPDAAAVSRTPAGARPVGAAAAPRQPDAVPTPATGPHGEPGWADTGVAVAVILERLAERSKEEILRDNPTLTADDLGAALRYAARVLRQERGVQRAGHA